MKKGESNEFVDLMELNCDFFSRKSTTFNIKKGKEKSARVVFFREFKIAHSYTLEMSYAGFTLGQSKN